MGDAYVKNRELMFVKNAFVLFRKLSATIPEPLGIGKVELEDGEEITGFLCEAYVEESLCDITASGGWKNICL